MYVWLILIAIILFLLYLYFQNNIHSVTIYKLFIPYLHPNLKGKKIIFISDTHFRVRVSHNFIDQTLIRIEELQPDIILFGGDIVHRITSDFVVEHAKDFFFQLGKIAPTYVVYGNHDFHSKRVKELSSALKRAGVYLLQNEAEWISFNNASEGFWLLGLGEDEAAIANSTDALAKIDLPPGSKNEPKILLAHFPHLFEKYLQNDEKRPDITLSGHTHGGQVILPVVGGLFAPGQGRNPYYDYGMFTSEEHPESRLIVTRGIGNSTFPFRINNRPEIVQITFDSSQIR